MVITKQILDEFRDKRTILEAFSKKIEKFLLNLLGKNNLQTLTIARRIKEEQKLEEKIKRKEGKYQQLYDITDIVGLRIITYFSEDVDTIANVIESHFKIDYDNTIDKRKVIEADRFGYLSLHYIVEFNENMLKQKGNEQFVGLKAEIQVRSILQHAWAEIEHDLGYKIEEQLPRDIRRSFSRIAGLLEIADIEFNRIRNRLTMFEKELILQMKSVPETVELTKLTLKLAFESIEEIRNLDIILRPTPNLNEAELQLLVRKFNYVNVYTIGDLIQSVQRAREKVIELSNILTYKPMYSIEYIIYYLLGNHYSYDRCFEYFLRYTTIEEGMYDEEIKKIFFICKYD